MGKAHSIAVLAGAVVNTDAMPEGLRSLNESADDFLVQAGSNAKHRQMMPDNRIERLGVHDTIFFGAVGQPAAIPPARGRGLLRGPREHLRRHRTPSSGKR
ncbi:hypothetical protein [Glutamicibacter sp.]|uniref:hypothetical protein n=1 Tax=Glutamicibacter sp. TaxID=1931995 RepID=UPI002FC686E6